MGKLRKSGENLQAGNGCISMLAQEITRVRIGDPCDRKWTESPDLAYLYIACRICAVPSHENLHSPYPDHLRSFYSFFSFIGETYHLLSSFILS
jgi:hypothetical protein